MPKYLIEDIIPPEKKHHRAHTKKASGEGRRVPLDREVTPEHLKIIPKKNISEAFPENPREMIAEQLRSSDTGEATEEIPSSATPSTTPSGSVGMGTWARDLRPETQVVPTKEIIPPQFPGYGGGSRAGSGGNGIRLWLPWLLGVVLLGSLGYFLLNFFAGATITILPKHELIPLDQKFTALKSGAEGKLSYAIMVETASSSSEVPATGEKTVTTKASGKILVYNEQVTAQRLIKNTRFQSPSGKIYRISDSITIPKGTFRNGTIRPGSIEVTVYADEAGPEYNSPPVDFTVPGLKNSQIYQKVYARSNGPLSGGASGMVKTVSDQDLKQAGENLRIQLETKLRAKARGNLAGSQVAYDKGIVVSLGETKLLSTAASAANKAVVSAEGSIAVVTFRRADLVKAIVGTIASGNDGAVVEIKNLDTLDFGMEPQKGDALLSGNKLDFTLKGNPELSWVIDENAVKTALLGLSKGRFNEALSQFPSVERAKATVRPVWKRSFPEDPSKISVVLVQTMPSE